MIVKRTPKLDNLLSSVSLQQGNTHKMSVDFSSSFDKQTEFQIKDRLSFMQFLGLQIGDDIPDANTIWNFKELLQEHNLTKTLFSLFTQQLLKQGIVAREGSIVDASFVDVPKQRNSHQENADIEARTNAYSYYKTAIRDKQSS